MCSIGLSNDTWSKRGYSLENENARCIARGNGPSPEPNTFETKGTFFILED
jgi:hypothetical protein